MKEYTRHYSRDDRTPMIVHAYLMTQPMPLRTTQAKLARQLRMSRATTNYALRYLFSRGLIHGTAVRGRSTIIDRVCLVAARECSISAIACGLPTLTATIAEVPNARV